MNGPIVVGLLIVFGILVYNRQWIWRKVSSMFRSKPLAISQPVLQPISSSTIAEAWNEIGRAVDSIDWRSEPL